MSLVPAVTELMLAELLYLQYDSPTSPVYMYINSTGVQVRSRSGPAEGAFATTWSRVRICSHVHGRSAQISKLAFRVRVQHQPMLHVGGCSLRPAHRDALSTSGPPRGILCAVH